MHMEKNHTDRILWGREDFGDRTAAIQGLKVKVLEILLENNPKII